MDASTMRDLLVKVSAAAGATLVLAGQAACYLSSLENAPSCIASLCRGLLKIEILIKLELDGLASSYSLQYQLCAEQSSSIAMLKVARSMKR
jgi:hypothetical protein